MNTRTIVEAYDLLRKREELQAQLKKISSIEGLHKHSVRLALDIQNGRRFVESGPKVEFAGPSVDLIIDMMGSQLTRQIGAIDKRLADLGITEDMAPQREEPAACAAAPEQDLAGVEIMVFDISDAKPGSGPCSCPVCAFERAIG